MDSRYLQWAGFVAVLGVSTMMGTTEAVIVALSVIVLQLGEISSAIKNTKRPS
jgi:hypothetical protein